MNKTTHRPLFDLGRTLITPGALEALTDAKQSPVTFLERHATGDWGECDREDAIENDLALTQDSRILSVYRTTKGVRLWIITEADRSATTILLPEEY